MYLIICNFRMRITASKEKSFAVRSSVTGDSHNKRDLKM